MRKLDWTTDGIDIPPAPTGARALCAIALHETEHQPRSFETAIKGPDGQTHQLARRNTKLDVRQGHITPAAVA
jgi:hypothetical protein